MCMFYGVCSAIVMIYFEIRVHLSSSHQFLVDEETWYNITVAVFLQEE
jgi:hypothetical protein